MPKLVWDRLGDRVFEAGLDHGVLYLPDGSAVPWNGLVNVTEKPDLEYSPVYYDGRKIQDRPSPSSFSGTLEAITYPDEFAEIEGCGVMRPGLLIGEQPPKVFGLSYRTLVGDDIDEEAGYKIHLIYNLVALPNEKSHTTKSDSPAMETFKWDIFATPEEISGFAPSATFTIDSREIDPWLLEEIEGKLYGTTSLTAFLISLRDLVDFINDWYRVKITDNGDMTWTAVEQKPGFITFLDLEQTRFQIERVSAVYLNEHTYIVSDTLGIKDIPKIEVYDNGDGTWTAITNNDDLIEMLDDHTFELRNANADYINDHTYRLSDTPEEV